MTWGDGNEHPAGTANADSTVPAGYHDPAA
jgi:hypothetical protein